MVVIRLHNCALPRACVAMPGALALHPTLWTHAPVTSWPAGAVPASDNGVCMQRTLWQRTSTMRKSGLGEPRCRCVSQLRWLASDIGDLADVLIHEPCTSHASQRSWIHSGYLCLGLHHAVLHTIDAESL